MKTRKVKIISAKDGFWYADRIGEIFTVSYSPTRFGNGLAYEVVGVGKVDRVIFPEDCIDVIEVPTESDYIKVVNKDHDCYISVSVVSSWLMQRAMGNHTCSSLIHFSELVVCSKTNDVIKCRGLIKDVVAGRYARPLITITLE